MFIGDVPQTAYDLNFRCLNVPVRVSPWFWLVAALLGARGVSDGGEAIELVIWVAVLFVSILVHEMGHALVIRHYGWSPRVVLYQFGGLAIYQPGSSPYYGNRQGDRTAAQVFISFAGPLAGFALAALVVAALFATGRQVEVYMLLWWQDFGWGETLPYDTPLGLLVRCLLYVNIFWGLVNLLPVFPLDGGKIAQELFRAKSPGDGVRQSLTLSMCVAGGVAVVGLLSGSLFIGIMFGLLAFSSYQMLKSPYGGGGFGGGGFGGGGGYGGGGYGGGKW